MTRAVFLGALGVAGAAAIGMAHQGRGGLPDDQQKPSAAGLHAEMVRDNLYVIRGGGLLFDLDGVKLPQAGTTIAFVSEKGVVLVDSKVPGWGQALLDKVKEITPKPVTTLINTHAHFDHVGSNAEFPATVEVVAHDQTAALMKEMRPVSGGPAQPNIFKESNGRGLPTRTFQDRLTLGSGNDRIDLYYFGRAHTSGDAWVVFPTSRVVHTGDAFATKGVPPLDVNNGASGVEYPRTIAKAVATLTDVDTVITGHHPTALTLADLKVFGDFVREFVDAVQAAKTAGRTIDDFLKTWTIPDRYVKEGYKSFEHLRSIRPDVEVIWNETK